MDIKVGKSLSKLKKRLGRSPTLYHLIFTLLFILALPIVLPPIANTEPSFSFNTEMTFEKTVDSSSPKPGDKINFTITYSNNMSETAYNVTIFEWMPSTLTFISSKPFYDGVSDPETGFYRWSRGNVPPNESGTVIVKAMVNNVPVGSVITNTAHLAYEFENGTNAEITSSVNITVMQAAGVDVYPDQIHSVAPYTGAWTEFNVTVKNTGNSLDTFNISLRSVAYNPSGSNHEWKIELYNSTDYPENAVYDDNVDNRTSWTDHGVVTNVTLADGESTWFMIKVIEAGGTSGSGDAYLDVQFIATSLFDPDVSDLTDKIAIVKSVAGITLGPDYSRYANPGDSMVYRHIVANSGQTEVIDINYMSPMGWNYSFWFDNGTALHDTDASGIVDIGELSKNEHVYILVKMTVPYSTGAGTNDTAVITATGVTSGNYDTANDTVTVKSAPILGIEKKLVSENPRYEGDVVTYQINITNLGNTRFTRIPLDDAFETPSLNFSSAYPAEDAYDETAGTIHWENLTALEPGQSMMVTVNFVATAGDDIVRESANVIDAEDEFGNLISATSMNKELKIIGAYTLTVRASPTEAIGGSFNVTWTEHGVQKDGTFATQKTITCDQDTTAEVGYPESPITEGDVRYVFTHYSPSATVTMDSAKTVTLNYRTEYNLTFQQIGSYEPVYITINGTQLLEAAPQSFWVLKGSTTTFSFSSPVTDTVGTTRYALIGVSGNTTATSVTVNAPTNVTGFYKTQYYLNVTTDPAGLDTPQYSGWYDEGAYATIEVETLTGGDGVSTRYRLDQWTGTGIANTTSPSTHIMIDAPKTATAHYVKQYYITIVSLHDSPTQSQWVDEGNSITASVTSPTEIVAGQTRWRCMGYNVDGETELGTSHTFEDIQDPHRIEFFWVQQFWLQVDTAVREATVEGTGWYDVGTSAPISAITPYQPSPTHRFVFTSWASTDLNEAPIIDPASSGTSVTMNNYYAVQANWQEQWYILVISLHNDPTPSQWVNATESLTVSVTSPADDDGAGTRYRCTGYRIDNGDLEEGTSYIFMNVQAAHKIEFEWIAQFYLTVKISPTDIPEIILGEGWYDENTLVRLTASSTVSVSKGVQYRFDHLTVNTVTSNANRVSLKMDAPKVAEAVFIEQFYLTTSTNFGVVSPDSGWFDAGSTVSIEATAPAVTEGEGYTWHGWTGTSEGSYSGGDNPATVTMNSAISETAYWKINTVLTITILNDTIASGDKIVVYGKMLPAESGVEILVTYVFPNGTQIEHIVYTDDEGNYEDTLLLDQGYLYSLFVEGGEWVVTARRLGDISHEGAQVSTPLKIEASPVALFHPALLAGALVAVGLIVYVPPFKKEKSKKSWWRATVILSCAGLIFGVVSLALNWVLVIGTATTNNATYQVGILLYPFRNGLVSITEGTRYIGADIPSMVDPTWQNIVGSSGAVLTLYLVPVGCALALTSLYKPKNVRQRNLKVAILVISGVLIVTSVVHAIIFVQGQVSTIDGAGIGYGMGVYMAIISGTLTVLSGLFAAREIQNRSTKAKKS